MSRIKIQITTPSNNVIKVSPGVSALSSVQLYLNELVDVDVSGGTDGYVLTQQADGTFAMETPITRLDGLLDTSISNPQEEDIILYQSGSWVNTEAPFVKSVGGTSPDPNGNVALPSPPPVYDEVTDLTDTNITSLSDDQILRYDSATSKWVNEDLEALPAGGTTGQALVKATGTDYDVEWADIAVDVQYHDRFQTDAETFRSGATDTVELYYTAKADGDGLAESASSDTPTAGKIIKRKIYYSEAAFADPDTGTWVEFTPAPADDASFATVKAALLEYLKARTGGTVPISLKQTWEEVDDVPAFVGLLNETYGSGAEAAYSTRRLNGNVTECMVIRRASDGTTTTIGFDGSGNIDESAINTFCTGTTCTVYQWLDQSGNGNTATAASTGEEPTIYTGGALVKEDGRVAIEFDGSNDHLDAGAGFNLSTLTMSTVQSAVENVGNTDAYVAISLQDTDNNIGVRQQIKRISPTALRSRFNTTSIDLEVNTIYKKLLFTTLYNGTNGFSYFDGSNEQTATASLPSTTSLPLIIGQTNASAAIYKGNLQEALLFNSSKSTSDRTSIEENIGDYFTQNTPLLDTYTGAAACYSLRLMRTAYTGDAVEVYNGSSYADIGFNVFGELDTVALAAHCGSNDGFVRTWYDQAGSNDATQSTTANMPKVYDGTNGVETFNGKPSIRFVNSSTHYLDATEFASESTMTYFEAHKANGYRDVWSPDRNENATFADSQNYVTNGFYDGVTASISGILKAPNLTSNLQDERLAYWLRDGSNSEVGVNGSTAITGTQASSANNRIRIGNRSAGANSFDGHFSELIAYNSDESSNRTGIETNMNTFYDIF